MAWKKSFVNADGFLSMILKIISFAGLYLKKFKFFLPVLAVVIVYFSWTWIKLPVDLSNETIEKITFEQIKKLSVEGKEE